MRKLFIVICLLLPVCVVAQNVKTLKHQADSLRKIGKDRKARKLYKKAVDLVLNYQERVTDEQWMLLAAAVHANNYEITKKKSEPILSWEYGNNGPKLKEKIHALSIQGVKCLFTYTEWLGMIGPTFLMITDSSSGNKVAVTKDLRTLLVWATTTDVYFQEFNGSNIYRPLTIDNDTLRDILINHADEMIHQHLKDEHYKRSESPLYTFEFHIGTELWIRRLYDPKDVRNPEANSKTWLAKLMPIMWHEYKSYRARAITNRKLSF